MLLRVASLSFSALPFFSCLYYSSLLLYDGTGLALVGGGIYIWTVHVVFGKSLGDVMVHIRRRSIVSFLSWWVAWWVLMNRTRRSARCSAWFCCLLYRPSLAGKGSIATDGCLSSLGWWLDVGCALV